MLNEKDMSPEEWYKYLWSTKEGPPLCNWENFQSKSEDFKEEETLFEHKYTDNLNRSLELMKKEYSNLADSYAEMRRRPLLSAMASKDRKKCDELFVGLFPTFMIDSGLAVTPRGDRIVMLHSAWPILSHRLGCLVSYLLTGSDWSEDVIKKQVRALCNLWFYRDIESVALPTVAGKSIEDDVTALFIMLGCDFFVLAHEFGHFLKGHTRYTKDSEFNHSMEFEADEFGMQLFLNVWKSGKCFNSTGVHLNVSSDPLPILGLVAPFMTLGCFSLMVPTSNITHPAPKLRINALLQKFEYFLYKNNKWNSEQIQNISLLANTLSNTFLRWSDIIQNK